MSPRGVQRQSTEESQALHALEQSLGVHPQLSEGSGLNDKHGAYSSTLTVTHSLLSPPDFLQISDTCESLSLSSVNLPCGVF